MRWFVWLLAGLLTACSASGSVASPGDSPDAAVARLRDDLTRLATAQHDAEMSVGTAVHAVGGLDDEIEALRDPTQIDDATSRWKQVGPAFTAVDVTSLGPALDRWSQALDAATSALQAAGRDVTATDERAYLEAEGHLLDAVRDDVAATRDLAGALRDAWPTYSRLHDITDTFVEQRWFYRSATEAADAYEVKIHDLLGDLQQARQQLDATTSARDRAAQAVNAAQQAADAAAPTGAPTTGSSPG